MQSFLDKLKAWGSTHAIDLGRAALAIFLTACVAVGLMLTTHMVLGLVLTLCVLGWITGLVAWYLWSRRKVQQATRPGAGVSVLPRPSVVEPATDTHEIPVVSIHAGDNLVAEEPPPREDVMLRYLDVEPFVMPRWPLVTGVTLAVVTFVGIQMLMNWIAASIGGSVHPAIRVAVALLALGYIAYYTWMVRKQYRLDYPTSAQLAVPISTRFYEEGGRTFSLIRMNDRDMRGMMKYLVINQEGRPEFSDQRILAATRRFEGKLKRKDWILTFGWAVAVVSTFWLSAKLVNGQQLLITGVVALLLGVPMMVFFFVQWLKWFSWRLLRTDKRTIRVIKWPALFWWLEGDDLPIEDAELNQCRAHDQDKHVSNSYSVPYGILDLDSQSDQDDEVRMMRDIPEYRTIAQLINSMRRFARA